MTTRLDAPINPTLQGVMESPQRPTIAQQRQCAEWEARLSEAKRGQGKVAGKATRILEQLASRFGSNIHQRCLWLHAEHRALQGTPGSNLDQNQLRPVLRALKADADANRTGGRAASERDRLDVLQEL